MKRKRKLKIKTKRLPDNVYQEMLKQGLKQTLNKAFDDINYCVVTLEHSKEGSIGLECWGPFKTKKEAQDHANLITYPCLKFVEVLWS
jgi:hypothetical protein